MEIKVCQRITSFVTMCTVLIASATMLSCDDTLPGSSSTLPGETISLSARLQQQNQTRANEQGFVTGDRMGIFIVDYVDGKPGALHTNENRASNVLYTFDGDSYKWQAPAEIYWRDKTTPIDVYGYYPGANYISDPSRYNIIVSEKQNQLPAEGEMSNYEASDFLWGKATNVEPTTEEIVIKYTHRMAGVWVTRVAGEGISDT